MIEKINELILLSHEIGNRQDYIQGSGGNISVKISNSLMAIKASGFELKNLNQNTGFAFVNLEDVIYKINFLSQKTSQINLLENFNEIAQKNEQDFSLIIKNATQEIFPFIPLRPSMETGFHCLIQDQFIIHSHSVYALVLCCSIEGQKILKEIFPQSIWIDFRNPGFQLTYQIHQTLKNQKSSIYFLQNHGIIISSNQASKSLEIHQEVNDKIIEYLNLPIFIPEKITIIDAKEINKNVLFPDQIVFGLNNKFSKSKITNDLFLAYSYILYNIKHKGLIPNFINKKNIDFIANMENEKYRMEVANKCKL
jgi:rhamnose utilization protein RhaD (predicted bifunctional aldolase and dehydrogenase)